MDPKKLIQLLMSLQNKDGSIPNLTDLFQNRHPPQPEAATHTGWEPDPEHTETTACGDCGNEKQTASDSSVEIAAILPFLLQILQNQNSDGAKKTNADSESNGEALFKILPLVLQFLRNQNHDGSEKTNADSESNGEALFKVLPLVLQFLRNQNHDGSEETNTDSGSEWSETEFAPNDVRRQTVPPTDAVPRRPTDGFEKKRPIVDGKDSGKDVSSRAKEQLRSETPKNSAPKFREQDVGDRSFAPKGLLPIAFAPPAMIHRLNLYFAHADQ